MQNISKGIQIVPEAFYDLIGYFIPGSALSYYLVVFVFKECPIQFGDDFFLKLHSLFAFLVVSYALGHIISYPARKLVKYTRANNWGGFPFRIDKKSRFIIAYNIDNNDCLTNSFINEIKDCFSIDIPYINGSNRKNVEREITRYAEKYIRISCPILGVFIQKRQALRVMLRNLAFVLMLVSIISLMLDLQNWVYSAVSFFSFIGAMVRYSHITKNRFRDIEICYNVCAEALHKNDHMAQKCD